MNGIVVGSRFPFSTRGRGSCNHAKLRRKKRKPSAPSSRHFSVMILTFLEVSTHSRMYFLYARCSGMVSGMSSRIDMHNFRVVFLHFYRFSSEPQIAVTGHLRGGGGGGAGLSTRRLCPCPPRP